jgi:dephospho-CoA kinase
MSKYPFESEEDDLLSQLEQEEVYQEETFGSRLRLFYQQFSSGTRALLSDALFREVAENDVIYRLEISCPNAIVYKRLMQKHQKISNEIRWIWPDTMLQVAFLIERSPLTSTTFTLKN